jgi:mannan endo-1,4-beta-mannosidase
MKSINTVLKIIITIFAGILIFSCTSKKNGIEGSAVEEDYTDDGYSWDFSDPAAGTAGWVVAEGEFWEYTGLAVLSRDDTTFGKGMLRLDVDFTEDSGKDWSEPKMRFNFSEPVEMDDLVRFTFDFYYNPYFATSGHFKSKIIALNGDNTLTDSGSGAISGKDEAGDFLKAAVTLQIKKTSGQMDSMLFSIAGYLTDYKGPVFFDNLRWETANYKPPPEPPIVINVLPAPEDSQNKKLLLNYLSDQFGKNIISGQMDTSWTDNEDMDMIDRVYKDTGKYPALKGFDFLELSNNNAPFFGGRQQVNEAIEWWEGKNNGVPLLKNSPNIHGIVTFCWHWRVGSTNDFYSNNTRFRIPWKDGELDRESDNFRTIVQDLDKVAARLKILHDRDIPVLWRPLHEASGGWFWWGASGAEQYKALWEFMHEYLTNVKQLNNLIWVWNADNAAWLPNPDTVDIVGRDLYSSSYASQKQEFDKAVAMVPSGKRIIALTENGRIPDPDECIKDGAMWSWFMTWNDRHNSYDGESHKDNFWTGESNNSQAHKVKVYNHPRVITLDKLPDLSAYRLN